MSGIEVDSKIPDLFNDIKLKKIHKWVTFKIENKKKIVVDELGDPGTTENREDDKVRFEEMKATLSKEPRFILYDFGFALKDGRKLSKLAFIFW